MRETGNGGDLTSAMSEATRERMEGVRRGLLHLHKALMDSERASYEAVYGRMTPGEFLQQLIHNPWFAWLRPFSEMVVQIDEMQEAGRGTKAAQPLPTEQEAGDILGQARLLLNPANGDDLSGGRYGEILQKDLVVAAAHAEVAKQLPALDLG